MTNLINTEYINGWQFDDVNFDAPNFEFVWCNDANEELLGHRPDADWFAIGEPQVLGGQRTVIALVCHQHQVGRRYEAIVIEAGRRF